MQRFQFVGSRFIIIYQQITIFKEQAPQFSQKAMHTINSVGIPWFRLFQRPEEHFVQTQSVSSIFLNYIIRIHHIVHRFRHFLNCPTANIFTIFKNKFGSFIFRIPVFEFLNIQYVIRNNIYIAMNLSCFILIF